MSQNNSPKPVDWNDPKWSLPNVHVSSSWGPGIEAK